VEQEVDENEKIVEDGYPKFSYDEARDKLIKDLDFITKLGVNTLPNLKNFHTYTVNSARYFSDVMYSSGVDVDPVKMNVNNNGKIIIYDKSEKATLNLEDYFSTDVSYVMIPIPETPSEKGNRELKTNISKIELPKIGKTVDYVFLDNINLSRFMVLTVENRDPVGTLEIEITFITDEEIPTLSPSSHTFNQDDYYNNGDDPLEFVITNNDLADTDVKWYFNNHNLAVGTGKTLRLDFEGIGDEKDISYLAKGTHIFTVTVTKNEKQYSVNFTLTVE
jgi:hypothetical protein